MKYRELTPNEIEAYNIGYKVGARQIFITDIEWENDGEHKIYRKGYLAGCKDRHRNNVNNVNNVKTETMSNSKQCQNRDSDNDTYIDTDIVIEEKNKGGMGGKREKANETSVFHVDCQNFDEIPPDILPVMKKYWTDEKIEKIRQDLAFMPSHDSCVATLLTKYDSDLLKQEPKSKATRFVKPTLEEIDKYCRSRGNNIDARKFFDYYESNGWKVGKNSMKSWEAAVRTWERSEYNTQYEYVPVVPKIADMNNFVRAKRLGEEND